MTVRTCTLMGVVVLLMAAVVASAATAQRPDGDPPSGDDIPEKVVRDLRDENGNIIGPNERKARITEEHSGGYGGYYLWDRSKMPAG